MGTWEEWLGHWCALLSIAPHSGVLPEQLSCESSDGNQWVIERTDDQAVISLRFDTLGYQFDEVVGRLMREVTPAKFTPLTLRYGYQDQLGLMLMLVFSMVTDRLDKLHRGYEVFCELEHWVGQVTQPGRVYGN